MSTDRAQSERRYNLPPLILHPFSDSDGPAQLLESSRAGLAIQGLLPRGESTLEELEQRLLAGRYCEIRMLFYVGRDLVRWIEQCLDCADREESLKKQQLGFQSFASYLIENAPEPVRAKLTKWGVLDYKAIFSRAIALNLMFADVPERDLLTDHFVRNYYKFADHVYTANHNMSTCPEIDAAHFDFELFASGEYTRMLERQWQES